MSLQVAKDLQLPDEAVTQTFGILAKRGVGKTYTASVMVEEMLKNQLHVVVIDPIGVWYGLRSSADGRHAGLPIIIAGGEHADVPIEPTSGEILAEMIVDKRVSMVIDLSLFRKGEQHHFMIDFAETLYRKNRQAVHLVLDEADEFAPQRPMGDEARMLGAIEDIVRRGRARGIGVTMITQRPAVLNKNVLTQIEVLVAMRLTSPQDRAAIAEWIKYHADSDEAQKMLESLGSLPIGTAWFWSPGWLNLFQRVAIRKRETFDSSSTPEVGSDKVKADTMATVNIDWLRQQLSATIEKVESEDPKMLRARIVKLERELADQKPQVEVHQVEVLPPEVSTALDDAIGEAQTILDGLIEAREVCKKYAIPMPSPDAPNATISIGVADQRAFPGETIMIKSDGSATALSKAERLVLVTLAQYPNGRTLKQVALITGYSHKGGGFRNALSSLRTKGYIQGTGDLTITSAGLDILGPFEPLPTGAALIEHWQRQLSLAPRKILEYVTFKYPKRVSINMVAEMTGYAANGGGFRNALSRLRTLGLIEGTGNIKASDDLF